MSEDDHRPEINMSAIPVAGIGGLGLVAMALVVAWDLPEGRWLLAFTIPGGLLVAAAIVLLRRRLRSSGPSGDHPNILFGPEPVGERGTGPAVGRPPRDLEELLAVR